MSFRCDDIAILIFDGSEYKLWKQRLVMFLKYQKCNKVIEHERDAEDTASTRYRTLYQGITFYI